MNRTTAGIILAVILIPSLSLFGLMRAENNSSSTSTGSNYDSESAATSPSPTAAPTSLRTLTGAAMPSLTAPGDAKSASKVKLSTTKGDITLTLYPQDAPYAVQNFVTLGSRGYYNSVTFHRVIKEFMIQAGDPAGTGMGGESIYGATFVTEINDRKFEKGTLGMARTNQPDTNGSQFFIVSEQAQPALDGQYTVFGQADEASMATVTAIAAVPTDASDKPTETVTITGFTILE